MPVAERFKKVWLVCEYEYERGWGSKLFNMTSFPYTEKGKAKALAYQASVNAHNTAPTAPDWYIRAEAPKEEFVPIKRKAKKAKK